MGNRKARLQAVNSNRKRLEEAGRRPFDVILEDELLEWVHERRSIGLRVSKNMMALKTRTIHERKCKT